MEKKFKAFDRVIIKDSEGIWQIDFYSYQDSDDLHHVMTYGESNSFTDEDILPYEGNEHLVGSQDEPDEKVRLEREEWVMAKTDNKVWILATYKGYSKLQRYNIEVLLSNGNLIGVDYIVRFSDFNPNDMDETSRHLLCVKNGKIVKYKG